MQNMTLKGTGVSHSSLQNVKYEQTLPPLTPEDINRFRLREISRSILWKQAAAALQSNSEPNVTPQQVARNAIRPVFCGQKTDKTATFEARPDSNGHVTVVNVMKCADAWCCPVCAPIIREHHAHEIHEVLRRHHATGGVFIHMLLPLKPNTGASLHDLIEILNKTSNRMTSGHIWRRYANEMSICGHISTLEVALTEHGEWSPVNRMTFFLDVTPEEATLSNFKLWLQNYWVDAVTRMAAEEKLPIMGAMPTVQQVGIHNTIFTSWLKQFEDGASETNLNPFQLLNNTNRRERDLNWADFAATMNGQPIINWSSGLKSKYGITSATDKDIVANRTSYSAVTGRSLPVETVEHTYQCPNGHHTVIPFDRKAEDIPRTWQCQCGQQAPEEGANTQNDDGMPKRTPFDMLMERRTEEELKETLEKRLKMHRDGYLPDYD